MTKLNKIISIHDNPALIGPKVDMTTIPKKNSITPC